MLDSANYYAGFSRRYGFADSVPRGHGYVRVAPVGAITPGSRPEKYANGRAPPANPSLVASENWKREREIAHLSADLKDVADKVRVGAIAPNRAVRMAMDDAARILAGNEPEARGGRLDVMRSIIRILSRHV